MKTPTRIMAALAIGALMLLDGCTTSSQATCNPACGSGQTCDPSTGMCTTSGCQTDEDCTGTTTHCDTATSLCVECLADSDCASDMCNTSTNTCAAGCLADSDCADAGMLQLCDTDGMCVQCRTDTDCPAENGVRYSCDVTTHACAESPCMTDADCTLAADNDLHCDVTTGGCVQCTETTQCSGSMVCVPGAQVCGQCAMDSDCDVSLGQTCIAATNTCSVTNCVTDASCNGGQRCDLTSGQCIACLTGSDCYFGGACVNGSCVEPGTCITDTDCILGTYCVGSTCVACRSAADCGTSQTCSSAGACVEPAACQSSNQCLTDRSCTSGFCVDASCSATSNSTPADAIPIATGSMQSLSATLCPNAVNDYVVEFQQGAGAVITVTSDPTLAALSLDLYIGPGSPPTHIAGTATDAGVVTAELDSAPPGSDALLIQVAGGDGTAVPYQLETTVQASGICTESGPPDNTIAEAITVTPGSYPNTLCAGDQHWFVLTVPAQNRLDVSVTSSAVLNGMDVEIWTTVNGQSGSDSYSETNGAGNASVTSQSIAGAGGQSYWVQLVNAESTQVSYTAVIGFVPQAPANNQCPDAITLTPGTPTSGNLSGAVNTLQDACGGTGGDSYWILQITVPSQVEIDLSSGFPVVMSLMHLCDGTGETGCTMSATGTTSLTYQALPAGTYIIRVAGAASGDAGDYTLTAQVSAAPAATQSSCASPIPLSFAGTGPQAAASGNVAQAPDVVTNSCGQAGGDAVYSFTLTTPQQIDAQLAAFPGASLSLVAAGSCSTPSGSCAAADASGNASLTLDDLQPGSYDLIVGGGTDVAGSYTVTVTQAAPINPPPNNTCASPAELPAGTVGPSATTTTTVGADDTYDPPSPMCNTGTSSGAVVFHLSVAGADESDTLQLNASFDAAMTVTAGPCGTGTVQGCANGSSENLVLPDLAPGDYYVWIDGYDGDQGTFTLTRQSGPPETTPTNQTCATAQAETVTTTANVVTGSTLLSTNTLEPTDCQETQTSPALALAGPDVVYSVNIPAGKTLSAVLDPLTFDGALFVVDSCSDNTCVAASDQSFEVGGIESVTVANNTASPEDVFVIVSSWTSTARGNFTLTLQLQ